MKIASASLQLASSHVSSQQHEVSESLKMWVGPRRPNFGDEGQPARPRLTDSVTLSEAGKAASSTQATDNAENDEVDNDPKLTLIRSLLELLTGQRIKVFNASIYTRKRRRRQSRRLLPPALPTPHSQRKQPATASSMTITSLTPKPRKPVSPPAAR